MLNEQQWLLRTANEIMMSGCFISSGVIVKENNIHFYLPDNAGSIRFTVWNQRLYISIQDLIRGKPGIDVWDKNLIIDSILYISDELPRAQRGCFPYENKEQVRSL